MKKTFKELVFVFCLVLFFVSHGFSESEEIDTFGRNISKIGFTESGEVYYIFSEMHGPSQSEEISLMCNGHVYGPYEKITFNSSTPDGRFIYAYKTKGEWYIQNGPELLGPFESYHPVFTQVNQSIYSYAVKTGGMWFVHLGPEIMGPYERITSIERFPGKKEFAFSFLMSGKNYVFDGESVTGPFDEEIYLSGNVSESQGLIYEAKKDGQCFLYTKNEIIGPYADLGTLQISPDGTRYAYTAEEEDGWFLIEGERKYGPYKYASYPTFSPDGTHLLYTVMINRTTYLFGLDGPNKGYSSIGPVGFSSDGETFYYVADEASGCYVHVNTKMYGPYDYVYYIKMSKTGSVPAYKAQIDGKQYIVLGDYRDGPFEEFILLSTLSDDGSAIEFMITPAGSTTSQNCILYKGVRYIGAVSGNRKAYLKGSTIIVE